MNERILVAEDSPTQAHYVRLVLEDEGYQVEIAANGRVALHLAQTTAPDLVLSDILMPEMSGHELCRAMKSDPSTRAIPVVIITAVQATRDRIEALEHGADDFLNKPVEPDELLARVRSLLRLKSLHDQLLEREGKTTRRVLVSGGSRAEAGDLLAVLRDAGYSAEWMEQPTDAVARVRAIQPDLIITEVGARAPNGIALCRSVKSADITSHVPILAIASSEERSERAEALEAGADDFLTRPVDHAELLTRVRSLLRVKSLYEQLTLHDDQLARQAEELANANAELLSLTAELEERVAARTAELEAKSEELRAMTQQLWQTAKLATMGELAASIAHELNNPLATITLRIESLLLKTAADDPDRRSLEIIDGEAERMAQLVARLLEFSRRGEQQVSTISLDNEVTNALELVRSYLRNRQVSPVTEFGPGLLTVHADRQQLRQVLLNLFTNACDAMPDGGTLTVRVLRTSGGMGESDVPVSETPGGSQSRARPSIVMEVTDTGTGIPAEILPRILEPFFTTKPEGKGTGLGLSICRRIVQEHNGRLEVSSEVGKGTTFRVTLPASDNGGVR